jgi:hypothetical protein
VEEADRARDFFAFCLYSMYASNATSQSFVFTVPCAMQLELGETEKLFAGFQLRMNRMNREGGIRMNSILNYLLYPAFMTGGRVA